ncbi:MAG TPA: arsenate reductase ArsC [Arthrobacter sp.]|nr:arsenate reductase ArsC [Arthrobacter sp.]
MTDHLDHVPGLQDNTELLHRISTRLAEKFAGVFARETVERYVFESYTALARTAKIKTHLPATTEHFANDRLAALAKSKSAVASEVPEVLFVCVQNAGRSQMAAALLNVEAKGRIRVRSAGSMPASELDPAVVTAMKEMGLDLSREYPKPLTDDVVRAADVVITMGCGDSCPIYPGKHYEDWELTDPSGQPVETVRAIRDQIHDRVRGLVSSLLETRGPGTGAPDSSQGGSAGRAAD